jgi:IclR family pca regulon transcriptional regulator
MGDSSLSSENPEEGRDYVRALARGLSVIECFDEEHAQMTLSDVAKRTGLTRPSARRALLTLQSLGYAAGDGQRFTLTPRALRLGYAYLSSQPLWKLAEPYIRDVGRKIGQTCSIAVLDGDDIVFVARHAAKRIINDYVTIGFRWPAYPTSLGRVLLSGLPQAEVDAFLARVKLVKLTPHTIVQRTKLRRIIDEVRERGWACTDRELDPSLRSIGVPIRDRSGRIIAAMNTNAPFHTIEMPDLIREYLPPLQQAAESISQLIAWRPDVRPTNG